MAREGANIAVVELNAETAASTAEELQNPERAYFAWSSVGLRNGDGRIDLPGGIRATITGFFGMVIVHNTVNCTPLNRKGESK